MSYEGRKDKERLYRYCGGSGPKEKLIPLLINAYDEVERLKKENISQQGHFWIWFPEDLNILYKFIHGFSLERIEDLEKKNSSSEKNRDTINSSSSRCSCLGTVLENDSEIELLESGIETRNNND